MKQWTKMERASLSDIRVKRLIADLGMKGFGLYAWMFIYVSCNDDVDINIIQNITEHMASRKTIRMVLHDYNLFEVNDDGSLHVCARASVDGGVRAPEPFNKKEKEENNTSSMNTYMEELKEEKGQWREAVCITSGFSYAQEMKSYREARHYFNVFVRNETSGRKPHKHLQMINSTRSHNDQNTYVWLSGIRKQSETDILRQIRSNTARYGHKSLEM